jgi:hypothetical protein
MNEEATLGRDAWDIEQMKLRLARHAFFVEPYSESVSASLIALQSSCERTTSAFRLVGIVESGGGWSAHATNVFGSTVSASATTMHAAIDALADRLSDEYVSENV